MMRVINVLLIICAVCLLFLPTVWAGDNLMVRAKSVFKPIPVSPPDLAGNPATPEKIQLGKMLYFEPRLSKSALISCNTCHNVGMGGVDFQETSIGHGWQKGGRNAPTVLNSVFNIAQFWDGRAPDLMSQAKGPIQASVEMNNTSEQVVKTLNSMSEYVVLFNKAFPGQEDPVTFDNMAKAIEVFEATLITPGAAFDKYLGGETAALTLQEKEGLKLFMDKGCSGCHGGMNMGGSGYFPFGVVERPADEITAGDKGRFTFTGSSKDQYVFKSPSLRNIALTGPYFHSGRVWDLQEAVSIMGSAQLGISLTPSDTKKIETFLRATTGIQPKVIYPILPAPTKDTPLPVVN